MSGKAEKSSNDITVLKKLQRDNRQNNNMRREGTAGSSAQGNSSISGSGSESSNVSTIPIFVNLTDIDLAETDTNVYDRILYSGEHSIIIDDPLTLPSDEMFLKWIDSNNAVDGDEIRIKVRNARNMTIQSGGNIIIPERKNGFLIDDSIWVILKYYNDASISGPHWMIAGTQFVPDVEINYGIFPFITNEITVFFGASYIDPPIITLGYQTQGGVTPISNIYLSSKLTTDVDGLYNGVMIIAAAVLPPSPTGHFISMHAICKL